MCQASPQEKKLKPIHPHPLYILSNLGRYLFLLLIPLIRILFHLLKNSFSLANGFQFTAAFSQWVRGAWLDLLILFLFLSLGILIWYLFTVEAQPDGLMIHRGVFRREHFFLPVARFTCITRVQPVLLRPFGGEYLRIDIPGGGSLSPQTFFQKSSDLVILLRQRDCQQLLSGTLSPLTIATPSKSYTPRSVYVFVLAAITSNSFAGIVLISTFLTQIGDILGRQFADMIYGTFEEAARTLAFGIPPAAAAIAYILLFGYLCAFSVSLFRHGGFNVQRRDANLQIKAGLLTKRTYSIPIDKISCVDIRRTLITLFLGLSTVFLHTVGYGKHKDDVSALIPCVNRTHLSVELTLLLPEYPLSPKKATPRFRSFFRYTTVPLWCCFGVLAGGWICLWLFPGWNDLVKWITLLCFAPAFWFLVIRLCDLATAGASCHIGRHSRQTLFTLRYSWGFTLHQVILSADKISKVTTTQSLFQKKDKRCDLHISSYSEGFGPLARPHHIRDLPLDEVERLFHLKQI